MEMVVSHVWIYELQKDGAIPVKLLCMPTSQMSRLFIIVNPYSLGGRWGMHFILQVKLHPTIKPLSRHAYKVGWSRGSRLCDTHPLGT